MSVFKVKLNNSRQGLLDVYENQRSAYIMGPNRVNRKLKDGEVFTDCNYWKRFAYPQLPMEEAFIEVVEDDGTVYLDQAANNTYPRVYNISTEPKSSFSANRVDIQKESGSFALFAQITNRNNESDVRIRLNGLDSAIIDLPAGSTQTFNVGEVAIGLLEVDNSHENAVEVQVVVSIKVVPRS
jgi:hypothetical protein